MAGLIPQAFINDLIDRADIVEVIDGRVALKKTGKNYSGLCPFHDEKSPSFSVSPDKQFFHCFGCQESGTALTFLMKFERMEFVEAVEALAKDLGLEVPREDSGKPRVEIDHGLFQVLERAERFFRAQLRSSTDAVGYLKERGLTGEVARDFGIGYAPEGWHSMSEALLAEPKAKGVVVQDATKLLTAGLTIKNDKGNVYDRFRHRIMFPIRDTRGRVIGFGGRKLGQEEGPKYLNSPETPVFFKGQELYGLYEARKALRNIQRLIVVEGYMDVVALAQNGVLNAVATLGTATGEAHFQKLYKYSDEVVCCFDGDKAGRSAAWRALESALPILNEHRQLKFVFLPNGEDPDSLIRSQGREAFDGFLDNATPGIEFLLKRLAEGLDLESLDGRAKFMGVANPYLDKMSKGILKDLVVARVREMSGMAAPVGGGPRTANTTAKPRPQAKRGEAALSERLAGILVKSPVLWGLVDSKLQEESLTHASSLGLLGSLMLLLEEQSCADVEEVIARWSDDSTYTAIIGLAKKPSSLDPLALEREFLEGLGRLVKTHQAAQRRAQLAQQNDPNINDLRSFVRRPEGSGEG
ncbi:MAG: DNA primase [Pseudomonadales bacterium]|nr:DNA primase [Pseudomonadales bacterium]